MEVESGPYTRAQFMTRIAAAPPALVGKGTKPKKKRALAPARGNTVTWARTCVLGVQLLARQMPDAHALEAAAHRPGKSSFIAMMLSQCQALSLSDRAGITLLRRVLSNLIIFGLGKKFI